MPTLRSNNTDAGFFTGQSLEERKRGTRLAARFQCARPRPGSVPPPPSRPATRVSILVLNRTPYARQDACRYHFRRGAVRPALSMSFPLPRAHLVVNATSIAPSWMTSACQSTGAPPAPMRCATGSRSRVPLHDAVTSQQRRAQGLATVDGLGMLLHQAVPGFERCVSEYNAADRRGIAACNSKVGDLLHHQAPVRPMGGTPPCSARAARAVHDADYSGRAAAAVEAAFSAAWPGGKRCDRPRAASQSACSATTRRSARLEAIVHPLVPGAALLGEMPRRRTSVPPGAVRTHVQQ